MVLGDRAVVLNVPAGGAQILEADFRVDAPEPRYDPDRILRR
jgi:hypothetical protein